MSVSIFRYIVYGVICDTKKSMNQVMDYLHDSYQGDGAPYRDYDEITEKIYEDHIDNEDKEVRIIDSPMDGECFIVGREIHYIPEDDGEVFKKIDMLTEHEKHKVEKELKSEYGIKQKPEFYLFTRYA